MPKQISLVVILLMVVACHYPILPTGPSVNFLPAPNVPALVAASPGKYQVGIHIEPGRYFANPALSDCHYQMEGIGGRFRTAVGSFAPRQWIVDILATDQVFTTSSNCGTWSKESPRLGAQAAILPGMWVVGSQIAPGTYTADAIGECDFYRLRDFHSLAAASVIEYGYGFNETVSVTISAGDTGFSTGKQCGNWNRVSGPASSPGN